MTSLLTVTGLTVTLGTRTLLDDLHFTLHKGETLAVVGESGAGKSTLAKALLRLLPSEAQYQGEVLASGRSLLTLGDAQMRHVRGKEIGLIPQDPLSSLNPLLPIGKQILEGTLHHHPHTSPKEAQQVALHLLQLVGMPDAGKRLYDYPHSLSGGMRQRAMIALAIAPQPNLLIADECTSALDRPLQAQMLQLMQSICREQGMGLLLISHNLRIVAHYCQSVLVLHQGKQMEHAPASQLLCAPKHPYTKQLVDALQMPAFPKKTVQLPYLQVSRLHKTYGRLAAVRNVSFEMRKGETLGLAGESGSGKSTVVRLLLRLLPPTSGEILVEGVNLTTLSPKQMAPWRRKLQIVFQDPFSSLSPRMSVRQLIEEPMKIHGIANRHEHAQKLMQLVGLEAGLLSCSPHPLSGGQRQRLAIARALATSPSLLVCDEPLSSLDPIGSSQILQLLQHLRDELSLTCLFVSHDLDILHAFCHRIAVMLRGQIVEIAPADTLCSAPKHPYTQMLLSPTLVAREPPSALEPSTGCAFASRCPHARPICHHTQPTLRPIAQDHSAACHLY